MRGRDRAGLAVLLAVAFYAAGAAASAPTAAKPAAARAPVAQCPNPQTPRALKGVFYLPGTTSIAQGVTQTALRYQGRTLQLCSQHFHCSIEHYQGCEGQQTSPLPGPEHCNLPEPGSWIEIHRAYAAKASCVGEVPKCCTEGPFVVLGFHAKVETGPGQLPLPLFRQPPYAEYSGSTSGPGGDEGGGTCKGAAEWSFTLGCDFKVFPNQLHDYFGEGARPLQDDVSRDLTRVNR